jgi:membrane protease YdiL (CAAX protease family)
VIAQQQSVRRALAWRVPATIALGCFALVARTVSLWAMAPAIAVGVLGVTGLVPKRGRERIRFVVPTAVGVGAFAIVRLLYPPLHGPLVVTGLIANVVAAVAEEAFFRRYVYGWLAVRGEGFAIAASAALFAAIHVPAYGVAVLPLDFAAGLLLGWQRRASGTWTSPAVSHIVANVLLTR